MHAFLSRCTWHLVEQSACFRCLLCSQRSEAVQRVNAMLPITNNDAQLIGFALAVAEQNVRVGKTCGQAPGVMLVGASFYGKRHHPLF